LQPSRVFDLRDTAQRPLSEVVATALRDRRFLPWALPGSEQDLAIQIAIELAAAWMQVLSPALLLERLEPPLPLLRGMATCRASLLKRSVSRTGALILRRPTAGLVSGWRHANAKCWRWWSLAARTR